MNARVLVMTNPVSLVTSTVPEPDDGKGVNPETGSSDSVSGVEVHEGPATGTVVVVGADVVVAGVVDVLGAIVVVVDGSVVVGTPVVVEATVVVVGGRVVVGVVDVVEATVVVVGGRVVVDVVDVVVAAAVQEIAMVPSYVPLKTP
jgi:hypothetical protein